MSEFYGTVRAEKNAPLMDSSLKIDIAELFFSKKNESYLANQLYLKNKDGGGRAAFKLFQQLAPLLMEKFNEEHDLEYIFNTYYADDASSTVCQLGLDTYNDGNGHRVISSKENWVESFRGINHKFLYWAEKYLKPNTYVPFRDKQTTGSLNEFGNTIRDVKGSNMLAEDIKELNVWRQYDINLDRSKFRYGNTIPVWQRSMNTRHYDRSNEGLREGNDAYRSSLNNPSYAYDMRRVKEMMAKYQDEKWFGF